MSPGWHWHSERWYWKRGVLDLGHSASTSRARPVGLGLLERANCPSPSCYHVVYKAFVDRNKECLVGEFIIQEIHKVKTSLGGIGIAQQHPVEGGEVGSGSQDVKQFPIARADPITHEADPTLASHVCRKGGSVPHRVLLRSSGGKGGQRSAEGTYLAHGNSRRPSAPRGSCGHQG